MKHKNFTSDDITAINKLIICNKSVIVLEIAPHTVVEYRPCSAIRNYFGLTYMRRLTVLLFA